MHIQSKVITLRWEDLAELYCMENKKLKQQLKIAEMEREFLKKAAAYFAKESQ